MKPRTVNKSRILNHTYIFWRNPINWYILLLVATFLSSTLNSLRDIVRATRLPANALGLFSVSFSNAWVLLASAAGATALLSSIPFVYPNYTQEVLREGQRRFVLIRLSHIMLISLIYTLFLLICVWLLSGSTFNAIHRWGKVLNSIAAGNVPQQLDIRFQVPLPLTQYYSPIQAACIAGAFFFTVMASIGLIMYSLSVFFGRNVAVVFASMLTVLDMTIDQIGFGYRAYRFSPWSWVRMDLFADSTNPYILRAEATAVVVILAFLVSLALALFAGMSKRALHIWQDPINQHE